MSAGTFITSSYRNILVPTEVRPIRIQPETLGLVVNGIINSAPVDPVTLNLFAKVSKTRREFGFAPYAATFNWTGAPPPDYDPNGVILLPILDGPLQLAIAIGQLGSYFGIGIVVTGIRFQNQR